MKSILCARSTVALAVTLAGAALPAASARPADPVPPLPGGLTAPLPEPASHREVRKRRVAARRQGPAILVHRGAAAFAPENSLEAYAAAMEYGADGCEVDVRRTVDGVLVLFHDDMLDRLTFGFGTVEEATYYELLALPSRQTHGRPAAGPRPPTFAALLELVRQRAMLLHLDVKRPGLEEQIARELTAADVWDHVVAVNMETAAGLARNPRVRLLRYKGPGLYAERRDLDPEAVRAQLARPGEMVMVDDPRVAARVLGRGPGGLEPLPAGLTRLHPPAFSRPRNRPFAAWPVCFSGEAGVVPPPGQGGERLLFAPGPLDGMESAGAIVARAVAIQAVGARRKRERSMIRRLESWVHHRSFHPEWMFHGLDGAAAATVLGEWGSAASAPALVAAFRRVAPALSRVQNPLFRENPLAWVDFRVKLAVAPALGRLRCSASREFLKEYVGMSPEAARQLAPLLMEDAARALLRQELSAGELRALLEHPNSAVRGTAVLDLLDGADARRRVLVRRAVPWAAGLPSAAEEGGVRVSH